MKNDNKLIAEFMGVKTITIDKLKSILKQNREDGFISTPQAYTLDELKYHTSWDWLMPVVEKIEREHKANFRIKCTWNEFTEYSIHQVIVNIEQGEMSKDKSCIYDSKKIYDYVGDAVKCKREATYQAVVEFIKNLN